MSKLNPPFSSIYKPYLSALGHLGRPRQAAVVRRRLLAIEQDFTMERSIASWPLARESDGDHYAQGLRLAGVPEHAGDAAKQLQDQEAHGAA